jgi:hypothetical protein
MLTWMLFHVHSASLIPLERRVLRNRNLWYNKICAQLSFWQDERALLATYSGSVSELHDGEALLLALSEFTLLDAQVRHFA